jgi:hypothetical protein
MPARRFNFRISPEDSVDRLLAHVKKVNGIRLGAYRKSKNRKEERSLVKIVDE